MKQPENNLLNKFDPDTEAYFDAFARYYDEELAEQGIPAKEEALVKTAVELTPQKDIHSALDLGAGTGVVVGALRKHAAPERIVAVDQSAAMLWHLRHKYVSGEVSIVNDSIENYLEQCDEKFDLITSVAVLEFLPDAPAAVSDAAQLLNPGGILAFTYVPRGRRQPKEIFVDDSKSLIKRTVMEYRWYQEEMEQAVTDSGLQVIRRVDGVQTQEYSAKTNTAERNYNFLVATKLA